MTIEGFLLRLVVGVLLLVLYNAMESKLTLKPEQSKPLGVIVLIIVLVFICFGGYLFAGPLR